MLSVVGFDDIPGGASHNTPLTTVRQAQARMGTLAAETVVKRIALESSTQHEVSVEPDWSCASTAPPPE